MVIDSTIGARRAQLRRAGHSRRAARDEVIISAHVCHPSLANDNLSGIVVATELAKTLLAARPAALHVPVPVRAGHDRLDRLAEPESRRLAADPARAGPDRAGRRGRLVYKQTRRGSRPIDRAAAHVVRRSGGEVRGLLPVRLRRAAVQLRRLRHPGGTAVAYAARGVSGVPHLRGQPGLRATAEELTESYAAVWRHHPDPGAGPDATATSARTASRSSASGVCTRRSAVRRRAMR